MVFTPAPGSATTTRFKVTDIWEGETVQYLSSAPLLLVSLLRVLLPSLRAQPTTDIHLFCILACYSPVLFNGYSTFLRHYNGPWIVSELYLLQVQTQRHLLFNSFALAWNTILIQCADTHPIGLIKPDKAANARDPSGDK